MAMRSLTTEGQEQLAGIARRRGVSDDAARSMLTALTNGGGTMAQFNHPEFGGAGQWMQGGMTMVSDLFNNALKATVDGLCTDLAALLLNPAPGTWREDAAAVSETCRALDLPVVLERSRSGDGAHLWWFFTAAVPAVLWAVRAAAATLPGLRQSYRTQT